MDWLKERGIWMIGTAGESAGNVYEADLKGALGLVMGAEGKGMRRLTRDKCDSLIFHSYGWHGKQFERFSGDGRLPV